MPTTCKKFDDQRHINSTNNWKIPKAVKKIDMRFLQIYITYCSIFVFLEKTFSTLILLHSMLNLTPLRASELALGSGFEEWRIYTIYACIVILES